MPRQDVPYGGAICRLRERIAEIFDKLGEKLHTINGVPGDGDGNVKIVSGSSAVVITNDPTQNEISVALDNSQLPAAAVSSVNGQTGAVALDAGDIPSDGNSDVQSDIDALQTMDGALQGNINAEALARQNADSTLQTNINAANAAISLKVGGSGNIGSDTKPIKIVNGDAVAVTDDLAKQTYVASAITANNANCVLTTGNQTKSGVLNFAMSSAQPVITLTRSSAYPPSQALGIHMISCFLGAKMVGRIQVSINTNGTSYIDAVVLNSNGTEKTVRLATGDII